MSRADGPLGFEPEEPEEPARPTGGAPSAPDRRHTPTRLAAGGRHAWLLGIAAILVVGLLLITSTRPAGPGAVGLPAGARLPPFAVVLATSDVVCDDDDDPCDANVARERDQGAAGRRPACEVRGPTVLNLCALTERRAAGSAWSGAPAARREEPAPAHEALA